MAVRDDFAAGEVLAAADLNDTFGYKLPYSYGTATPSTSDDGFLWYDSNSTPPVPKYWNGSSFATLAPAPGLELITSETFTSVSSVSVNSVFTSDYQNYRIHVTLTASSAAQGIGIRLRASGSDATGSDYLTTRIFWSGSTSTVQSATGTSLPIGENSSVTPTVNASTFDIYDPQIATITKVLSQATFKNNPGTHFAEMRGGFHNVATAYDGLTLLPDTGTSSGTIRIYGYKD